MVLGPPAEATALQHDLDGAGPSLTLLSGARGSGKTRVLTSLASADPATVYYRALPLPDPEHRRLLAEQLGRWAGQEVELGGLDWDRMWSALVEEVSRSRRRLVLLLDDAPRLVEGRSRVPTFLAEAWADVRARSLPVHLVLAGRDPSLAAVWGARDGALGEWPTRPIRLGPRDFRQVSRHLLAYAPLDRILAWGVFGGSPHRLRHLDTRVSLATNIQRLLLEPGSPLGTEGMEDLREATSSMPRYAGILLAMARGATDWGEIVAGTPGLDTGGQMAPYLSRLEELGLVRVERSLDAGPRSRRRRYRLTDPFPAFWYRLVLPHISEIQAGRGGEVWKRHVRPGLTAHMARQLPTLARRYLERYAEERLPSSGREVGGLWGSGYDLDVAGTLRTGAVVYGITHWVDHPLDVRSDDELAGQLRRTRYGFGREARIRLLVSPSGFSPALKRRAARDRLLHLVGTEALLGA